MPAMDQDVLAEIKRFEAEGKTDDPRYEQLLIEHHYVYHVCRMPFADWPEPVSRGFTHINPAIYVPMQGPSELGLSGSLEDWDRSADLPASTCRPWSSAPPTTPWTPPTCAGCPSSCPRAATCSARTAAT